MDIIDEEVHAPTAPSAKSLNDSDASKSLWGSDRNVAGVKRKYSSKQRDIAPSPMKSPQSDFRIASPVKVPSYVLGLHLEDVSPIAAGASDEEDEGSDQVVSDNESTVADVNMMFAATKNIRPTRSRRG
jgi:hypothetical protein